jgi:N utilization substance protein A
MVMVDEDAQSLLVVVPNDQLSLAIGRQGQNVRLASKLLGWRIDVKSEQRYNNLEDPGYRSILAIDGVDEALADQIFAKGIVSVGMLAKAAADDLTAIRAIDDEFAAYLIQAAQKISGEMPEKTAVSAVTGSKPQPEVTPDPDALADGADEEGGSESTHLEQE